MKDKTKKRIIIIGASTLQLPAIIKAKEMGFYVGVVDFNPQAIGISYADEYFNVSTVDEVGVYNAVKAFKADGIMTLATDMPMRSIAYTCDKLGLPGISYETAIKSTDKAEMIKAFEENDVEHPWYFILDNIDDLIKVKDKLSYPCISKPTDNSGSRGVILINNQEELKDAIKYSSEQGRNGSVIIEEYMSGNEVSVEIIVYKGTPHILAITDKVTTGPPHFVEIGHSQPSQLEPKKLESIKALAKKSIKAINLQNGPAHVEIMLTDAGPKMVELGARMGGGFITTHLVPFSTGIDMVEATIQLACNETINIDEKFQKGSAVRCIPSACGRLEKIHNVENTKNIKGIKEIVFTKKEGDLLPEVRSGADRLGYIISQADTAQEAIKICHTALKEIKIDISPCDDFNG